MPQRIPRRGGPGTVATMRDFLASTPWKVALRHWNLLASHDTEIPDGHRRSGAGPGRHRAADDLSGCADDLRGRGAGSGGRRRRARPDADALARPESWDRDTLTAFRELIALRRAHPALRTGGLRWVIETEDAIGFLRETADERLLVVAARAPWSGATLPGRSPPARCRPATAGWISSSPSGRSWCPAPVPASASGGWPDRPRARPAPSPDTSGLRGWPGLVCAGNHLMTDLPTVRAASPGPADRLVPIGGRPCRIAGRPRSSCGPCTGTSGAFVLAGRGPALLLLHGVGCDHRTWDPVIEQLTARYTVIAPDCWDTGGPANRGPTTAWAASPTGCATCWRSWASTG